MIDANTGVDTNFDPYGTLMYQPAFNAASTDYKNAHRESLTADADLLALSELRFISSRCRHMVRNNPVASAARDKFVTSHGAIKIQWKTKNGLSHPLMQELWDEHYANPCLDGKGNGDTLQATWLGDRFESGEAFARFIIRKKGNTARIPLKIQSIEAEYLDSSYMGVGLDQVFPYGRTRYGITFDKDTLNIPEFYNFFQERYFGIASTISTQIRIPVPAQDIVHIFERKRSNQWRGIPLLASSLLALYEIDDLCTATVQTQTSASAIAWVVERALGGIADLSTGTASTRGKNFIGDANKQLHFKATGGSVQYTNPGEKIQLIQSRDIGPNLVSLLKEEYQKIASAINIPYYQISGDTSGMDFSSIRAILTSFRNRIEFIYNIVTIPDALAPWSNRFKEIALALGYPVEDAFQTYQYPRWYGVDDLKDAQADLLEVMSGFTPISAIWSERGYTQEEITQSKVMLDDMGFGFLFAPPANPAQNNGKPSSATTGS